jgi:hypothetical protein
LATITIISSVQVAIATKALQNNNFRVVVGKRNFFRGTVFLVGSSGTAHAGAE